MDCSYTAQGTLMCQRVQLTDFKKSKVSTILVQTDKCEYVSNRHQLNNHRDATEYSNCPKTCEYNDALFDGNWKQNQCRCCRQ